MDVDCLLRPYPLQLFRSLSACFRSFDHHQRPSTTMSSSGSGSESDSSSRIDSTPAPTSASAKKTSKKAAGAAAKGKGKEKAKSRDTISSDEDESDSDEDDEMDGNRDGGEVRIARDKYALPSFLPPHSFESSLLTSFYWVCLLWSKQQILPPIGHEAPQSLLCLYTLRLRHVRCEPQAGALGCQDT